MEIFKAHDFMACPGNICVTDPDNHLRNWYPDEAICIYRPRPKWLKRMIKIQKLFLKGEIAEDKYFMLKDLEEMKRVRKPRGSNPDRMLGSPLKAINIAFNTPNRKFRNQKLMVDTTLGKGG